MGIFDLNGSYNDNIKYSFNDMCIEIINELIQIKNIDRDLVPDEGSIRDKFKHDDGTGIINKLNDLLHFDIEAIAKENDKEFFDMLKLLKYLFNLEKLAKMYCIKNKLSESESEEKTTGKDNEKNNKEEKKIPIIEILAKPHLENIPTDISPKSVYGEEFLSIYKEIISVKPSLHEIHKRLYFVNEKFEYLTNRVFDYVLSKRAMLYPNSALLELDRIEKSLYNNILSRIKDFSPHSIPGHGVFQTFFIIFISHCFLCHDIDRIQINNDSLIEKLTTDIYLEQLKSYKDTEFDFDIENDVQEDTNNIIYKMIENLSSKEKDSQVEKLLNLISYNVQIANKDFKNYKYALKKFPIIAQWFNKSIDLNKHKKIKAQYIVTIMQEILDVVSNNPKDEGYNIINNYYKYKNKKQTLLSALRTPEKADAIIVEGWIKRLENRLAFNLGGRELIIKKRKIDNIIYETKKYVYSFQNIEDIEFVADFLYRTIFLLFINEEDTIKFREDLCYKIIKKSQQKGRKINITTCGGENILAFFKDLYMYKGEVNESVAENVVNEIQKSLIDNTDISNIYIPIRVNFKNNVLTSILFCQFHKNINLLFLKEYRRVREDEYIERAKRLGLEKFFKNF